MDSRGIFYDINSAKLVYLTQLYEIFSIKKMKKKCNIFFNNQYNLQPNYIEIKLNRPLRSNSSKRNFNLLIQQLIREELRKEYQDIYHIDVMLKVVYYKMNTYNYILFDKILIDIFTNADSLPDQKLVMLHQKIEN